MSNNTEDFTTSDVESVPDYVAENYRALVADGTRNLTFKKLAKQFKRSDPSLAAWARKQAADAGADVTPDGATSLDVETRAYGKRTVEELKELVADRGIDASELKLKADYVAALELADESAKDSDESDEDADTDSTE